jgi:hypothetical protein
MPSPKDGTAGTLVLPTNADPAQDADQADPGAVESVKAGQRESGTGKYGSVSAPPFNPASEETEVQEEQPEEEEEPHWIEVKVIDDTGKVMAGEPYKLVLSDGRVVDSTLDENGSVRLDGIDAGNCTFSLTKRNDDEWSKA